MKELESRLSFIRKREAEAIECYNQLKFGENEKENSACKLLLQLQKENHQLKEKIFEVNFLIFLLIDHSSEIRIILLIPRCSLKTKQRIKKRKKLTKLRNFPVQ